jgi:hypothetical protein
MAIEQSVKHAAAGVSLIIDIVNIAVDENTTTVVMAKYSNIIS